MNDQMLDSLKFVTSNDRVVNQKRSMEDPRLAKMLNVASRKNRLTVGEITPKKYYWDDRRFRLNTSSQYNSLPLKTKEIILEKLSNHSILTSYFIEKSAITYCAKMALLSETFDEKMFYIQTGYEEVIHFLEFELFLKTNNISAEVSSPFSLMINQLIQDHGREISFLVAQVLLEGMAIHHYSQLKESCIHEQMKIVVEQVLHDETRHHGSGIVLLDNVHLTQDLINEMVLITKKLLPILKKQKDVLENILLTSEIEPPFIKIIFQEIEIDKQMDERVEVIINSIKKLKNPTLKVLLLSAMDY